MTSSEAIRTTGAGDVGERAFYGRRTHWDVLMVVNLMLVGVTSMQLWTLLGASGDRPIHFYVYSFALVFYICAFFWLARIRRLTRTIPVLRLNGEGLAVRPHGANTLHVTPWERIAGVAYQNDAEIGVRLAAGSDGIEDVLALPLALRSASADEVRKTIDTWLQGERGA